MSPNSTLLENQTTTIDLNTATALPMRSVRSRDEVLVQVSIVGGTATVELWGRASKRLPFLLLTSTSIPAIIPVARMAELKAVVPSISGATVDVEAFLDE